MFPRSLFITAITLAYFAIWVNAMPAPMGMMLEPNMTGKAQHSNKHHTQHLVGQNRTKTSSSSSKHSSSPSTHKKNNSTLSSSSSTHEQKKAHDHKIKPVIAMSSSPSIAQLASPGIFLPRTRYCGNSDFTNETTNAFTRNLTSSFRKNLQENTNKNTKGSPLQMIANQTKQVDVAFHVISDGKSGNLSQSAIDGQIKAMNTACESSIVFT